VRCTSVGCESRILRASASRSAQSAAPAEHSDQLGNCFRVANGLTLIICPIIYSLVGAAALDDMQPAPTEAAVAAATLLGVIAGGSFLVAWACFFVGLYRSWQMVDQIRDKNAAVSGAPSPSLAVGLLWAPAVNVLWMFRAYGGLPRALAAVSTTYHLDTRKMNKHLALAPGVLTILLALVLIAATGDDGLLTGLQVLVLAAWYLSGYLFGHEMFAVTWDIRRRLTR